MGKGDKQQQGQGKKTGADVIAEINSTVVNVLGQEVFYNHPELGKCCAKVIGVFAPEHPDYRNSNGQIQSLIQVSRNDGGGLEFIKAVYSGDGSTGTFRLYAEGDLRN